MYWKLHSRRQCRFRKRRADKAPPPPKRRCGLCPPCSETKRRLARVLRSPPKARHKAGAGFEAPYRCSIAPYCAGTPPRRRRRGLGRSNPLPAWVCANTESPPARGRAWKSLRFCCANPQPCARRSQKVSATLRQSARLTRRRDKAAPNGQAFRLRSESRRRRAHWRRGEAGCVLQPA